MRTHRLRALLVILPLLVASRALAGCPNRCTLDVDQPEVPEGLECVVIRTPEADDCDCEVRLVVDNTCESVVEPNGFDFTFCGDEVENCDVVSVGDYGVISVALTKTGEKEHKFAISVGDAEGEITVVTRVDSFAKGCAFFPRADGGGSIWAGLFAVGAWFSRLRRRRERISRS